jgi:hypothetical protein
MAGEVENTFWEIAIDRTPSAPTGLEIASLVVERLIQEGGEQDQKMPSG